MVKRGINNYSDYELSNSVSPFLQAIARLKETMDKRHSKYIQELEGVYKTVHRRGKATFKESIYASIVALKSLVHTMDIHFLVIAMMVVIPLSGSLVSPDLDVGFYRPLVVIFNTSLAVFMSAILVPVFYPLHLRYGVSFLTIAIFHVGFSSALMSQTTPLLGFLLPNTEFYPKNIVFFKFLGVYAVGEFFFLARFYKNFNFEFYKKLHKEDSFFKILPVEKRGVLISMMAQDHYVEITTEKGTHLHRMPMKAAIEMVKGEDGLQVHRSHWVAASALHALEESPSRIFATLRDGRKIPVSKSKVAEVRKIIESH